MSTPALTIAPDVVLIDPMEIWQAVCVTDVKHTKSVTKGKFKLTAIDAQYQVMTATKIFGPFGLGWGVRDSEFKLLELNPQDPHDNVMSYTGQLWYKHRDQIGVIELASEVEVYQKKDNSYRRNTDLLKKAKTDAMTKGLSLLGFNADVFLGRFDDNKYVEELRQQQEQAEREQAEQTRREQEEAAAQQAAYEAGKRRASKTQAKQITELCKILEFDANDWSSMLNHYQTSWEGLTHAKANELLDFLMEAERNRAQRINAELAAMETTSEQTATAA